MKRRFDTRALGRLKPGQMNKTEAAYAAYLDLLKRAGELLWFEFEAIKLKLADNTFLTIDFAVMRADGVIELHDVKGARAIVTDDAKVKMKVAAEKFPFVFKLAFPKGTRGSLGWDVEEI